MNEAFETVISLAVPVSAQAKDYASVPYLFPRHIVTCHISAMNCITNDLERECCIKGIVKEGVALLGHVCHICTSSTLLLTFWAIVPRPYRVSSLCATVILYCTQFLSRRVNARSRSLARRPPSLLSTRGFLRERMRGRSVWDHVTECQTERNSQIVLRGPTYGCGTQEDLASSLAVSCGGIIQG